jgi:hypothetical protein
LSNINYGPPIISLMIFWIIAMNILIYIPKMKSHFLSVD